MTKRGADAQSPPWDALVGDGFFDLGHVGQDAPGTAQERLTLGGEGERSGGAQQQPSAKTLFSTGDDPTDAEGVSPNVRARPTGCLPAPR